MPSMVQGMPFQSARFFRLTRRFLSLFRRDLAINIQRS